MSLLPGSCSTSRVRRPFACLLGTLLATCVILILAVPALAFIPTRDRGLVGQSPLQQGNSPTPASSRLAPATFPVPSEHASTSSLALLWLQQTELSDPGAARLEFFGYSVALSGDTALIGACNKTVSGQNFAGAAYIFTCSGMIWSEQAELTASDGAANDCFGSSVALDGDTALIGAEGRTVSSQGGAGAAYIFTRTGTTWSQQAELSDPDAATNDYFGRSVALSGDTALVGAEDKTVSGHMGAGAAYVYTRTGTTWSHQAELTASDGTDGDQFGISVALSGDTALVGADYTEVGGHNYAGDAYIYTRTGTAWSQQAELSASDTGVHNNFGTSVALSGGTALIGAPDACGDGEHQDTAGAAYIFTASGATWTQQAELSAAAAATGDSFGDSVALSGGTAVVGAPDAARTGPGAAYVEVLSSSDETLKSLTVSAGTLSPSFTSTNLSYTDGVANNVSTITVTPTVNESHARYILKVGATTVTDPIALNVGDNVIDVVVTAQDGSSETYGVAVTRAALLLPTLALKLSGLKSGALKLGKSVTARGTVTPTSLAGDKVILTVQRKLSGQWLKLTSLTPTISAKGTYNATYKPAKTGSYRIEATIAKTATSTAAASKWLTFKVK
jgi:hypothetical protein